MLLLLFYNEGFSLYREGITLTLYISKSNMPSSLKECFSDSCKGVSDSRIREGLLDKLGLFIPPPLMAELQLEGADDDFILDCSSGEFLAS